MLEDFKVDEEAATITSTYSSVILSSYGDGKNWSLSFKELPDIEFKMEGDIPTREDIKETILKTSLPGFMAGVVISCVDMALRIRDLETNGEEE